MRILHSIPKEDGFYMPAEFSEHYGCIMIFPHRRDSWQNGAYAARKAFAEVIGIISKTENVTVCARNDDYDSARFMLPENVRVVEMESDDSWARDVAPTFVTDGNEIRGIDWGFNAWGGLVDGLYFPWDKDNKMARKLCDLLNIAFLSVHIKIGKLTETSCHHRSQIPGINEKRFTWLCLLLI